MSLTSLLINEISIVHFGDPQNVGGTNVPTQTTETGIFCSVQQSSGAARTDQDIEGSVSSGKTFFDRDPGVKAGDQLLYNGRVLVVEAPAIDEAGRGVLWTIRWTETL
jgi:hypothetical protein